MKVVRTIRDLAPFHSGHLVPTMGALHEGHAELIRAARDRDNPTVVSLFVNPAQFNEQTDFDDYPRDLDTDAAFCDELGVECLFVPDVDEIYPPGELDRPAPLPSLATDRALEDQYRPGHFKGVYRVCRRLFEITRPRGAYFGEKDWQQLQLVRALVAAENLPVRIVGVTTAREPDGLALSSRNILLTPDDRERALAICRALQGAARHDDPDDAERAALRILNAAGIDTEYFAVRNAETLDQWRPGRPGRALVAARVGRTRLIDNAPWPAPGIE